MHPVRSYFPPGARVWYGAGALAHPSLYLWSGNSSYSSFSAPTTLHILSLYSLSRLDILYPDITR